MDLNLASQQPLQMYFVYVCELGTQHTDHAEQMKRKMLQLHSKTEYKIS